MNEDITSQAIASADVKSQEEIKKSFREDCLALLRKELKPAIGCTEPAAIALAVARTMELLQSTAGAAGNLTALEVELSGNIYKNAYAVTIPGTGKAGLELSAALGAVLADSKKELLLFKDLTAVAVAEAEALIAGNKVNVQAVCEAPSAFYIHVTAKTAEHVAETWTEDNHTNLVKALYDGRDSSAPEEGRLPGSAVGAESTGSAGTAKAGVCSLVGREMVELVEAIEQIPIKELAFLEESAIMNRNMARAELEQPAGLGLGHRLQELMKSQVLADDLITKIRIEVAAACDGRMGGLPLPVMSTTGSGNQGILVSLPIAIVAEEKALSKERFLRGLALGNLTTAYVKQHIGKLAPICGCAIAAGLGVSAAVAWMMGGSPAQIEGAARNMMANLAGMICDGAKDGCALKLTSSACESVLAAFLALGGTEVGPQEGIVDQGLKGIVANLVILCREGMPNLDRTMIGILQKKAV